MSGGFKLEYKKKKNRKKECSEGVKILGVIIGGFWVASCFAVDVWMDNLQPKWVIGLLLLTGLC